LNDGRLPQTEHGYERRKKLFRLFRRTHRFDFFSEGFDAPVTRTAHDDAVACPVIGSQAVRDQVMNFELTSARALWG
jgi:hypothetical protein